MFLLYYFFLISFIFLNKQVFPCLLRLPFKLPWIHQAWTLAWGARDPEWERISPSFRWQISHLQGWVWARGPRTVQVGPPRSPGTHISLESQEGGRGRGGRPEILERCWWNLEVLLSWAGDWGVWRSWDSASDFLPGTFYKLTIWVETLLGSSECPCEYTISRVGMWEWVQTIREDAVVGLHYLEKEMVMHSSFLTWKNPMNIGACQPTVHMVAKSQTRLVTSFSFISY